MLISLSEQNLAVVKYVEKVIIKFFDLESLLTKPNYSLNSITNKYSLKTNLSVVIDSNKVIMPTTRKLLTDILKLISEERRKENLLVQEKQKKFEKENPLGEQQLNQYYINYNFDHEKEYNINKSREYIKNDEVEEIELCDNFNENRNNNLDYKENELTTLKQENLEKEKLYVKLEKQ